MGFRVLGRTGLVGTSVPLSVPFSVPFSVSASIATSVTARAVCRGFVVLALCLAAWGAVRADTLVAGPAGVPLSLTQAVGQARDGDTIEVLPGVYREVLVIEGRRLTLRGLGERSPVIDGEGRMRVAHAMWTIRGGEVTLENLEFRGMRAADGGGAGVRQEGGKLTLKRCSFFDNEHAVLSTNVDTAELRIAGSVFAQAPKVRGGLYHLLNVGRIGLLHLTGSRLQQGFEGHLIKSRAKMAFIGYNYINDGVRGGASYKVELASGGEATVIGNVIAQGIDGNNPTLLAYGTEGRSWERNALYVAHNTFINYGWLPAIFVRVFGDGATGPESLFLVNNLLVGPGLMWPAVRGEFMGNRHATRGMLRDIWTNGLELPPGSIWRGAGVDPRAIDGHDLAPTAEFDWPAQTRELAPGRSTWSPGAFQR
jgi:hypothetical protein